MRSQAFESEELNRLEEGVGIFALCKDPVKKPTQVCAIERGQNSRSILLQSGISVSRRVMETRRAVPIVAARCEFNTADGVLDRSGDSAEG